jgi:TrmH family RNA methyltransferase
MNSSDRIQSSSPGGNITVVLVRPDHPENIGLTARSMKSTGFSKLRLVQEEGFISEKASKTAVHSMDILENALIFKDIVDAVGDCHIVFAATSKPRKNYSRLSIDEAVTKILSYSSSVNIGLLFGNERTGLTGDELQHSNFIFTIPQASRQPSYNLAFAVLLTLFSLFKRREGEVLSPRDNEYLSSEDQRQTIIRILEKVEEKGFIYDKNREHMTERIFELFRRMNMTEKDRKLLLALFSKLPD